MVSQVAPHAAAHLPKITSPGFMSRAADKAHSAMKTTYGFCTHPLTVGAVSGGLIISLGTGVSIPRGIAVGVGAYCVETLVSFAVAIAKVKKVEDKNASKEETKVVMLNPENFKAEVLSSKTPVIVEAFASWCPPCKAIRPHFDRFSLEMDGKIKCCKFDVDKEKPLAKDLGVEAMPTFLLYKGGRCVGKHVGDDPAGLFSEAMKQFL